MKNVYIDNLDSVIENFESVEVQKKKSEEQRNNNEHAIRLLQSWITDESGYDENIWNNLKKIIEQNRLSKRKRFND